MLRVRAMSSIIRWITLAVFSIVALGASPPQQAASTSSLPKVLLLATGGTISNRTGGRLTVDELIKSIPNLEQRVRAEGEQFLNVSSGELTLTNYLDLAKRISERFRADSDLAGIVVTCGTDTLEELAYFLHLTIRDPRPVVVVGAMRNPSQLGYEGPANLEDGFRVAGDATARGLGVLVVLNDEIHSARDVSKTDSQRLDTFSSRDYGALGRVLDRPVFFRKPVRRHTEQSEFDLSEIKRLPRVDVIWTYQDAPGDLIKAAVDAGAKGIVIAGAGFGTITASQREAVAAAVEKSVFVVTTTRTGSGSGGGGGGRGGQPTRRIGGDDLQPVKARILLMLALSKTEEPAEVQRMFREY